MLADTVTP